MNVIEGLRRIQRFWPNVTFKMAGADRLDVMHRRLDAMSHGQAPDTMGELLRRMDEVGLGIHGNLVVLDDGNENGHV